MAGSRSVGKTDITQEKFLITATSKEMTMAKLSCIGYCSTYSVECKSSDGIDRDGLVHCQAENCPQEEASDE